MTAGRIAWASSLRVATSGSPDRPTTVAHHRAAPAQQSLHAHGDASNAFEAVTDPLFHPAASKRTLSNSRHCHEARFRKASEDLHFSRRTVRRQTGRRRQPQRTGQESAHDGPVKQTCMFEEPVARIQIFVPGLDAEWHPTHAESTEPGLGAPPRPERHPIAVPLFHL